MTSTSRALALLALSLFLAPGARAQQKWVEAAGVARAEPGEGKGGPGRQAALQAALTEAVQQVAIELLTASETVPGKPPPDPAAIAEKVSRSLSGDPSAYIARFQIREDRGVQPRLLLSDPDAKAEYQLLVAAQVDVAKVRQRIGARAAPAPETTEGAAAPPQKAPAAEAAEAPEAGSVSTYEVELTQIVSYKEYAAVRDALLGKIGASRATPVEFGRGRAVLIVDSPVPAPALAGALRKALDGQVGIEAVPAPPGAADGRARLRILSSPALPPPRAGLTR